MACTFSNEFDFNLPFVPQMASPAKTAVFFLPFAVRRDVCNLATEIPQWWHKICPESGHKRWMDDGVVTLLKPQRQKATKVKCKRDDSITKQSIFVDILLLKKYLGFAGARSQMNTTLSQIDHGNLKLNKFAFGIPRLPDLLCNHWFISPVWNFCCWVADVPPRETSPAARSEE